MQQLSQTLVNGDVFAVGGLMLALALGLWLVLRAIVPRAHRPRLRTPLIMLLLYVLFSIAQSLLPAHSQLRTWAGVGALLSLLLACGRLLTVLLLDWLLGRRRGHEPPRIVRDIFEAVFLVFAVLVTLRSIGVDATSLLTTSAVLTAIIGLSLQDTLGNLFAGLSLQAQQAFNVGDWIQLDKEGEQVGQVVEINWRATKLRTLDNNELMIPNGQLARATLINCSRPTPVVRRTVLVTVPYDYPTRTVHGVILRAVTDLPGVAESPPPSVLTRDFRDYGIQYWVRYFIEEFERRDALDGMVRDRLWYALHRAGIAIATPHHRVVMHEWSADGEQKADDRTLQARVRAIRGLDFLRDLPDSAIAKLALHARTELYETGEIVVRQGDKGEELYLCLSGELSVLHTPETTGLRREIARLRKGGMFGELSLMTGEPRSATVQAEASCELVVIGKSMFSEILAENPAFAELISERLAERQAGLEAAARNVPEPERSSVAAHKNQLLARVRAFFAL